MLNEMLIAKERLWARDQIKRTGVTGPEGDVSENWTVFRTCAGKVGIIVSD